MSSAWELASERIVAREAELGKCAVQLTYGALTAGEAAAAKRDGDFALDGRSLPASAFSGLHFAFVDGSVLDAAAAAYRRLATCDRRFKGAEADGEWETDDDDDDDDDEEEEEEEEGEADEGGEGEGEGNGDAADWGESDEWPAAGRWDELTATCQHGVLRQLLREAAAAARRSTADGFNSLLATTMAAAKCSHWWRDTYEPKSCEKLSRLFQSAWRRALALSDGELGIVDGGGDDAAGRSTRLAVHAQLDALGAAWEAEWGQGMDAFCLRFRTEENGMGMGAGGGAAGGAAGAVEADDDDTLGGGGGYGGGGGGGAGEDSSSKVLDGGFFMFRTADKKKCGYAKIAGQAERVKGKPPPAAAPVAVMRVPAAAAAVATEGADGGSSGDEMD